MDPDEALRAVIAGLDDDDHQAALLGLTDYAVWVSRGGFPADTDLVDNLGTATATWADRHDDQADSWASDWTADQP